MIAKVFLDMINTHGGIISKSVVCILWGQNKEDLFQEIVLKLRHSFVDRIRLWPALVERVIPISIGGLLFLLTLKLGVFKERHVDKFREDLSELQSLRKMSEELHSSE